jgi:uncharacterized protein (TIGR01777 family)
VTAARIAISGSSGLVGSSLVAFLAREGCTVVRLVRSEPRRRDEVLCDPATGRIDAARFEGLRAVVHLAGVNIAASRWSASQKERIRSSRVDGTRLVAESLAGLTRPPATLVCASAIGYYGDRGDERLDENSPAGSGFLPETCVAWEAAADPARQAGIRVVTLRIGVVLSTEGGALARMLTPFRLGLGGRLGHGRQRMSWITLEDLVRVIGHVLWDRTLHGPVNAVAPQAVTNAEFTASLGRVLRRPTLLPLPAAVLRLLLGEMGQALLLDGSQVVPERLCRAGFEFRHGALEPALTSLLGRAE